MGAENLVKRTWVNPAEGGSSGRTFHAIGAYVPDPRWSSPLVKSTHSLNMSTQPPSEALKSGCPMAVYAPVRLIDDFSRTRNTPAKGRQGHGHVIRCLKEVFYGVDPRTL